MNVKSKNAIQSVLRVLASNVATIIAGIIVGFIIPKVMTVEGYGYYKTFTLYVTYTGLFSIGIIDGIVLDFGGTDYSQFDRPLFRSIFRWYLLIHGSWIAILLMVTCCVHDLNYKFIIIMIAVYMFFANIVGYYQQISQITQRFREYSSAKIIQSVLKVIGGLVMMAIYIATNDLVDYQIYVCLMTFGFFALSVGYIVIYKDLVYGAYLHLKDTWRNIVHFVKIGIPLMVANLCGTLILTLDRQFVNILFTNAEYAVYAFAYNMLSLVTVATSAVSTVLYPMMKRTTEKSLQNNYSILISTILVFVYAAMLTYFPLCAFVRWFLPQYVDSLVIFRIIFPGLAISSAVTVVMHNYYKTFGDNNKYFKRSILILLLSAFANGFAYLMFKSTASISVASIVTMIVWYLYVEQYFVQNYGYKRFKNFAYLLCMMCTFYLITNLSNWIISGILYIVAFALITKFIHGETIKQMKSFLKK